MPSPCSSLRPFCFLAAALVAASASGCGSPSPSVDPAAAAPTISWDSPTYTLATSTTCFSPCIYSTATVQVVPVEGGPGTPSVDMHPVAPPNAAGKCDAITAAAMPAICGKGVAGTWRFRATATAGKASTAAEATVVVP